jgi:hypothetical protein
VLRYNRNKSGIPWFLKSSLHVRYLHHAINVISLKIFIFLDVTSCSFVDNYRSFGRTCHLDLQRRSLLLLPWRWMLQIHPKHLYLSARLHSVTSQKTVVLLFTAMRRQNLVSLALLPSEIDVWLLWWWVTMKETLLASWHTYQVSWIVASVCTSWVRTHTHTLHK